jgi:hypothetical protein
MTWNSGNSNVNLRNIDIQNTMAKIATENLIQFQNRDQLMADYAHLFVQYFENVFLNDLDNYFVPMLQTAVTSDIDVFFIKCSFYMKGNKAHKPLLLSDLYDAITYEIGGYLNENGYNTQNSEFLKGMSEIFFDFLNAIDLSDYFISLKNRYDNGLFAAQSQELRTHKKLKTNLTVPELVFLFKSLDELKPGIFDIESKEELFSFISENFESKRSSDVSTKAVKNGYYEYDQKARDLWLKHFSSLVNFVSNLK